MVRSFLERFGRFSDPFLFDFAVASLSKGNSGCILLILSCEIIAQVQNSVHKLAQTSQGPQDFPDFALRYEAFASKLICRDRNRTILGLNFGNCRKNKRTKSLYFFNVSRYAVLTLSSASTSSLTGHLKGKTQRKR